LISSKQVNIVSVLLTGNFINWFRSLTWQIQRHGARFPTLGAAARIVNSLTQLQSATKYIDPQLAFLTNYTYALGVDDLVPFGASQFVLDPFPNLRGSDIDQISWSRPRRFYKILSSHFTNQSPLHSIIWRDSCGWICHQLDIGYLSFFFATWKLL
jgi:hypothetical protein